MILFCEDCGEKNELKKRDVQNGHVVFRCAFCHYLNSYPIPVSIKKNVRKRDTLFKRDNFFKKLKTFPEIMGAFLYHEKIGVIKNQMPIMLQNEDLDILGRYLSASFLTGQSCYSNIHQMMAVISDKHITIQRIEPHVFILIASKIPSLPGNVQDLLSDLIFDAPGK